MKKLNNKGFAMSTVLYGIVIMVMLIVTLIITLMATNRSNGKWLVEETEEELIRQSILARRTIQFRINPTPATAQCKFIVDGVSYNKSCTEGVPVKYKSEVKYIVTGGTDYQAYDSGTPIEITEDQIYANEPITYTVSLGSAVAKYKLETASANTCTLKINGSTKSCNTDIKVYENDTITYTVSSNYKTTKSGSRTITRDNVISNSYITDKVTLDYKNDNTKSISISSQNGDSINVGSDSKIVYVKMSGRMKGTLKRYFTAKDNTGKEYFSDSKLLGGAIWVDIPTREFDCRSNKDSCPISSTVTLEITKQKLSVDGKVEVNFEVKYITK